MCEEDTKIKEIFDKDIENFGKDLEKMIEHLNIVIATHNKQVEEIERLNNIINDFEEELERESNMKEEDTCLEHNTFIDIKNTLKAVLKRFQEIKGSNNNE